MSNLWKKEDLEEEGITEEEGKFYRLKGDVKEEVIFDPIFGWLSDDDLFDLRQREPRLAP